MVSIEAHVGCLIEVRLRPPVLNAEIDRYDLQRGKLLRALGGQRVVNCTDLRELRVLPAEQLQRFLEIMKGNNPTLVRAAFLISHSALGLQMMRVIREANNPNRRYFYELQELKTWLAEVLTPEEQARLHEFLEA